MGSEGTDWILSLTISSASKPNHSLKMTPTVRKVLPEITHTDHRIFDPSSDPETKQAQSCAWTSAHHLCLMRIFPTQLLPYWSASASCAMWQSDPAQQRQTGSFFAAELCGFLLYPLMLSPDSFPLIHSPPAFFFVDHILRKILLDNLKWRVEVIYIYIYRNEDFSTA